MCFRRKARMVYGGHMTNPPESLTYSSVVSHDSVRINFVIADQNGLDILAAEIGNTYLNAPFHEKIYLLSFLLDWPPIPHSMLIVGWWIFKHRTEAIGKLNSVPLLC